MLEANAIHDTFVHKLAKEYYPTSKGSYKVAGLFAGIGGLEVGLRSAGHEINLLCDIDPSARTVLKHRFRNTEIVDDVSSLTKLDDSIDLVCAGFPCQNLSQVGNKAGLRGSKSRTVRHLFSILEKSRAPWILIENVPFMLRINKGRDMKTLLRRLHHLGYQCAWRVVDASAFGLPQRRRRFFLVGAREGNPSAILHADNSRLSESIKGSSSAPIGFYWTEGNRGVGLAIDMIPPLKGGSAFGIPSAPAVLMPDGRVLTPTIQECERLQGFRPGWTRLAPLRDRWRLVGNAVPPPMSKWLGKRFAEPKHSATFRLRNLEVGEKLPNAGLMNENFAEMLVSEYPVRKYKPQLSNFMAEEWRVLSFRALHGFVTRAKASNLRFPPGFIAKLAKAAKKLKADSY